MVATEEKQYQPHTRVARQSRPILNGIIFLLATNLLAKGVLGLNAYTPPTHSNLQGSLYVNFGRPQQHGQATHQQQQYQHYTQQDSFPYQYNTFWNPIENNIPYTTPRPQPIHQHQIINIHDSTLDDTSSDAQFQEISRRPPQHVFIEKQVLSDAEPVIVNVPKREANKKESKNKNNQAAMVLIKRDTEKEKDEVNFKVKPVMDILRLQPQHHELINKLAHLKRQTSNNFPKKGNGKKPSNKNKNNVDEDEDTEVFGNVNNNTVLARQAANTTTTSSTTSPTTTTSTTTSTTSATTSTSTASETPTTRTTEAGLTTPAMNMTNGTGGYYYGNNTGNDNVSITIISPTANMTYNFTSNETTTEGYYYYPAGEYGPSNGFENISITYGPPNHYDNNQHFHPSQIDHYYDNPRRSDYDAQHYHSDNYHHHDNTYYHGQQHDHQHHHDQQHHDYHQQHHNYQHNPYQNQIQQFNEAVQKFYNKYDYHYPYFNNF